MNHTFPFTAIVGMELAKRSLLYHAVDPGLGGLLLMGHRGCAKSTLARAFREILPPPAEYETPPFVEVPLGTTEDRLLGAIDASRLLENGEWSAQSGLIQQANQGVLYIDEVNLLPDHLVDSILDSAASGQHRIERDGLSKTVTARYILIGSMNPEEGDLRPQLLDRFTHGILVHDDFSVEERREIVRARMDFDDDPEAFILKYEDSLNQLRDQILKTRERVTSIEIPENLRTEVAQKAASLKMEGVRAELGVLRTARCSAAWQGNSSISDENVEEAWILCLGHRLENQQSPTSQPPQSNRNQKRDSPDSNPQQKPQNNRMQMPKTAASPRETNHQPVQLKAATGFHHNELATWWEQTEQTQPPDTRASGAMRNVPAHIAHAKMCWSSSLRASLQQGWHPGKPWKMRFRKPVRRSNVWLFLDASRSTGAIEFLAAARNAIRELGAKTYDRRFHILVLQNGKTSWWIKRGTAQAVKKNMDKITSAAGKSHLRPALDQLKNAIQKQGVLPGDRVLLCSDGMLSPEESQSVSESKARFRKSLQSLTQRIRSVAWLHPQMKRGMQHWLPQLTQGSSVKLISID